MSHLSRAWTFLRPAAVSVGELVAVLLVLGLFATALLWVPLWDDRGQFRDRLNRCWE